MRDNLCVWLYTASLIAVFLLSESKRPQVVTKFFYENNNENKTAGGAQMRGEWEENKSS